MWLTVDRDDGSITALALGHMTAMSAAAEGLRLLGCTVTEEPSGRFLLASWWDKAYRNTHLELRKVEGSRFSGNSEAGEWSGGAEDWWTVFEWAPPNLL